MIKKIASPPREGACRTGQGIQQAGAVMRAGLFSCLGPNELLRARVGRIWLVPSMCCGGYLACIAIQPPGVDRDQNRFTSEAGA